MKFKFTFKLDKELSTTSRGFTYLPLSYEGRGGMRECDICKNYMQQAYLVFAIHRCVCPRCFDEWLKHSETFSQNSVKHFLKAQQERHQDEWYEYQIYRMVMYDKGFYS